METSLKERALRYIRSRTEHDPDVWINGGELEREALLAGWKASNASRRLRELCKSGMLLRRIKNGSVEYHYANTNMQDMQKRV